MYKFLSHNETETKDFARKIATVCKQGDVIILNGDLGSGKTKFTEGFLSLWNLQDEISSPTFTIVNEYTSNDVNIYHFDLYRLADLDEFYAIGGQEYFENGICIVEWGNLIEDIIPENSTIINIYKDNNNLDYRNFEITTNNNAIKEILK